MSDSKELTLKDVQEAVGGTAAAFRCRRRLQPGGGEGDKVFPPTYAGAVYAVEQRRVPGRERPVACVLLDSVQSQANRMEEALQEALDAGDINLPVIIVDFSNHDPRDGKAGQLLDPVGKVTSLQVPHRLADALLRDSEYDGNRFRDSAVAKAFNRASLLNATSVYQLCPTALVFGMWDSAGPKGGLGAKFERAIVSEVVGVGASFGVRTSSRIDPIITATKGITVYMAPNRPWTTDATAALKRLPQEVAKKLKAPNTATLLFSEILKGSTTIQVHFFDKDGNRLGTTEVQDAKLIEDIAAAKPAELRDGKVSQVNLGNVTPDYDRYDAKSITGENRQTPDPMRADGETIQGGRIRPGGVTVEYAEQITTMSLIALRRLRFPVEGKQAREANEINVAARAVLVALGLCAANLAFECGMGLRSRCLLWPEAPMEWEVLDSPGEKEPRKFRLTADNARKLLKEASSVTAGLGLTWRTEPLNLTPSADLVDLVRKSQMLAQKSGGQAEAT